MTAARDITQGSCPACDEPLFGWVLTSTRAPYSDPAIVDRCERCGLAVRRGEADGGPGNWLSERTGSSPGDLLVAEEISFDAPNLRSLQGALGEGRWAQLDAQQRLHLTPEAVRLLLRKGGWEPESIETPALGPNIGWFWLTALNALTFNPDFAREARTGRLRPKGAVDWFKFVIDGLITVMAGLLIAPLVLIGEVVAALMKRGGRMRVRARRASN